MKRLMLFLFTLLVCCTSPVNETPSRTTDTHSRDLATEAEQLDFLAQYVTLKSAVSATEFHIVYHDNSNGLVPGPSDWDIRAVMRVDDVGAWVEGKEAVDSADLSWANDLLTNDLRPISDPTFYANATVELAVFAAEQIIFLRATTQ